MFRIAFIIFREFLEIALLLSIISAVIRHFKGARLYLISGSMIGVIASSIFAFFTHTLSNAFYGSGDEIVDAIVILFTVGVIIWTITWMQGYTNKVRALVNSFGATDELTMGAKCMLILTISTVILREGIEIILLIYGISSVEDVNIISYIYGFAIGALLGTLFGVLTYCSLLQLSQQQIFKISSGILMLIAAGLASEAAGVLSSAGIIITYSEELWDTSWLISNTSIIGNILRSTIGYQARPRVIQAIFYAATIIITLTLSKIKQNFIKTGKKDD